MSTNNTENNEDDIRKYRKQVNLNGWMMNINQWAWGSKPTHIKGYCPLFWRTWLTLGLSPLILIGKFLEFIVSGVFEIIKLIGKNNNIVSVPREQKRRVFSKPDDYYIVFIYEYKEKWENEHPGEKFTIPTYQSGWNIILDDYMDFDTYYPVSGWFEQNTNWADYYPQAKANLVAREVRNKKFQELKDKMMEKINTVIKYTSWTVKPIMILSSCVLSYFVLTFLWSLTTTINWSVVLTAILYILAGAVLIVVAAALVSLLINGIKKIINKLSSIKPDPATTTPTEDLLFVKILRGLKEGVLFLIETVTMIYKKECPLVEYTDKTGPIEKRK